MFITIGDRIRKRAFLDSGCVRLAAEEKQAPPA